MSQYNILFVCAANRLRSPTAEYLYRGAPDLNARSAGLRAGAKHRLSEKDLTWADVVVAMEREHCAEIRQRFRHLSLPPLHSLDIPDEFAYLDPGLQLLIQQRMEPILLSLRES